MIGIKRGYTKSDFQTWVGNTRGHHSSRRFTPYYTSSLTWRLNELGARRFGERFFFHDASLARDFASEDVAINAATVFLDRTLGQAETQHQPKTSWQPEQKVWHPTK